MSATGPFSTELAVRPMSGLPQSRPRCSGASKAGVLPLSVFGALLVSAARIRAFMLERGIAVRQGLRFLRTELPGDANRCALAPHVAYPRRPVGRLAPAGRAHRGPLQRNRSLSSSKPTQPATDEGRRHGA